MPQTQKDYKKFLFLLLLFLPWAAYQPFMRMPADAAWLFTAAQRLLTGAAMTDAYFDNNPPMSYLVYVPSALIAKLGFSPWAAVNIFTFMLIALGAVSVGRILLRWQALNKEAAYVTFIAWLAGVTICCQSEFGQKDHFIAIALLPFLLAQYAITEKQPKDWIVKTVLVLGTPFILLKPHYGLLPAAMLLHRCVRERRLSFIPDFDFMCLAIGTIIYAAVTYFYFPDFLAVVLPASLSLYVGQSYIPVNAYLLAGLLLCSSLAVLSWFSGTNAGTRNMKLFLCAMAFLAMIPFWVQNKGFALHLLPALSLLLPALGAQFQAISQNRIAAVVAMFTVIAFTYAAFGFRIKTHDDYRQSSLAQLVREYADKDGFLVESGSTSNFYPVALYEGVPVASRFPSFWFMSGLIKNDSPYRQKFSDMIAEDLAHYHPKLVLAYADRDSFIEFFNNNPSFIKEWQHYKKHGQYTLDPAEYNTFKARYASEPVKYDIYLRN